MRSDRRVRGMSPRIEPLIRHGLRPRHLLPQGEKGKKGDPQESASPHTGSAIEYFTWLSAKLDSIEAMPSSRVSLFFRNAS